MNDPMREAFEETTLPQFPGHFDRGTKYPDDTYIDRSIEDHWQTFQEGWEAAIDYLKKKQPSEHSDKYSDIVSDGGFDPRN